ncbi:MAG: hypothetical protein V3V35_09145 [Dehalococcoidia bacterium]
MPDPASDLPLAPYRALDLMGPFLCDAPAFKLSRTPAHLGPAAAMGMHNERVYKTLLCMSDDEYRSHLASGVFD